MNNEALTLFKKAVSISPSNTQYRISLINLLIIIGEIENARRVLLEARELGANMDQFASLTEHLEQLAEQTARQKPLSKSSKKAEIDDKDLIIQEFSRLYENGQFNEIFKKYERLSLDYKNNAVLQNIVGLVYAEVKKYERATEFFLAATDLEPAFSIAWVNMGMARKIVGDFNGAINSYKRAMQ